MASHLPIPAPPRTPTPPTPTPEEAQESLNGNSRTVNYTITYDPRALSPMSEGFPAHFGSMNSALPSPAGSMVSPALSNVSSLNSDSSMGPPSSKGPFNFQTQTISAAPIIKSVCEFALQMGLCLTSIYRTLVNEEGIDTSTVVCLRSTKSFLNLLQELHLPCRLLFRFLRLRRPGRACLGSRRYGYLGVCAML